MTPLKDKIQDALDESRMLVLGAEILIGFEFSAAFQNGFEKLSDRLKVADTIGLALMLFVLVLLIAPCVFHQLVVQGEDRPELHRFATRIMDAALLPFALGLGITIYIPAEEIAGQPAALVLAICTICLTTACWYGPALVCKPKEPKAMTPSIEEPAHTALKDKIRQALTEARVIIPGNQALLGFQFAVILQKPFSDLPPWIKWVHLASLLFITVSTVLLMTPAAFHRIVEQGEETVRFCRLTHFMVLSSLPPLALGVCGDLFIVIFKVSNRVYLSLCCGALMLCFFLGMWFGYTSWRRGRLSRERSPLVLQEQA